MGKKLVLSIALFLAPFLGHAAMQFYKYVDKEGNTIISNTLPAEYANNGYAIVTARGNVLEIVPPKKSEEELAKELAREQQKFAEKKRREAEALAKAEQEKKDQILLKTFASEQAIIRNRDNKITAIEVLESITKENVNRLTTQLEKAQKTAAQFERNGKLIPKTVIQTIEDSKRQIADNLDFLSKKDKEKQEIHVKYQKMIERFKTLQEE